MRQFQFISKLTLLTVLRDSILQKIGEINEHDQHHVLPLDIVLNMHYLPTFLNSVKLA